MNWLTGGALVAAVVALWQHAKSLWVSASCYAVVRYRIDFMTALHIGEWLYDNTTVSRFEGKCISTDTIFVDGKRSWHAYESVVGSSKLLWFGWMPIWVSVGKKSEDMDNGRMYSGAMEVSYIRGTIDFEEVIRESTLKANSSSKGYYLTTFRGRDKSVNNFVGSSQMAQPIQDKSVGSSTFRHCRFITCDKESVIVDTESRKYGLDSLCYSEEVDRLVGRFAWWISNKKWYSERRLPWKFGATLHGMPGTGKTSLVRAIAIAHQIPIYRFELSTMNSNEMVEFWESCCASSPCIAVFEDIDGVFDGTKPVRESQGLSFDTFLQCLSGIQESDGVAVFVTTNFIDKVAQSVLRPGRAGIVVELKPLNIESAKKIASRMLEGFDEAVIDSVVSEAVGKSHAWIVDRCAEIASSFEIHEVVDACEGSCVHVTQFCDVCNKQTSHLVINEDRYGIATECVECGHPF